MGDDYAAEHAGAQEPGGSTDVETHFTIIAVISLVFSVPVLLLGALIFTGSIVGAGFAEVFSDVPGIGGLVAGAGLLLGLFIAAFGVPGTVAGIGLLQRRRWAKPWTIATAVLNLLNIPLGTLFGVYALWVMTRPEVDQALAQPA